MLLCVQCTIETVALAVLFIGVPRQRFDSNGYAGATAAVGST
jgi:hypothetical protein